MLAVGPVALPAIEAALPLAPDASMSPAATGSASASGSGIAVAPTQPASEQAA